MSLQKHKIRLKKIKERARFLRIKEKSDIRRAHPIRNLSDTERDSLRS